MNKKKLINLLKNIYPYLIVVIIVVLIRTFLITPAIVDGQSMEPNLKNNNIVILNKLDYRLNNIRRFDIVVLKNNNDKLIKRIIGLPGDYVEYKNGVLYVNGFIVEEKFKHEDTADFKLSTIGYIKIPGDKYFVVGDNRINSIDSRVIGLIDKKEILGSVSYKLIPLGKIK